MRESASCIPLQLSGLEHCATDAGFAGVRVSQGVLYAAIAQLVERILGKDEVASSNLADGSICPISSVGRALPLQGRGRQFESVIGHFARVAQW